MNTDEMTKKSMKLLVCSAYRCSKCTLEDFDIIGLSSIGTILVKVVQNEMPRPWIIEQMKALAAPPNTVKVIHIWHNDQDFPEIVAL